jgi:hypothetical protein
VCVELLCGSHGLSGSGRRNRGLLARRTGSRRCGRNRRGCGAGLDGRLPGGRGLGGLRRRRSGCRVVRRRCQYDRMRCGRLCGGSPSV